MELAARDGPEEMAMAEAEERFQLRHCNSEASSSHDSVGDRCRDAQRKHPKQSMCNLSSSSDSR